MSCTKPGKSNSKQTQSWCLRLVHLRLRLPLRSARTGADESTNCHIVGPQLLRMNPLLEKYAKQWHRHFTTIVVYSNQTKQRPLHFDYWITMSWTKLRAPFLSSSQRQVPRHTSKCCLKPKIFEKRLAPERKKEHGDLLRTKT